MANTTTTTKTLGGYGLVSFKEAGGEETLRFEAYLTKDGKKIAHVSNGGTGGCNSYHPIAAGGWDVIREFEEFAKSWNEGNEFAGFEDEDQFVNHLIEVVTLNKKRNVIFLVDDQDWFENGVASSFKAGVTFDQALAALRSPHYASRNPRIWDKTKSEFVPVV